MCGIGCYFAKEAILSEDQYDILLRGASFRGGNGIGIGIYNKEDASYIFRKYVNPYSVCRKEILKLITDRMKVGSLLFIASRATPETEQETTEDMLQPIYNQGLILVHNGGVTDVIHEELEKEYKYSTQIDSEAIIAAYDHFGNNMKEAMEYLVGSFAFVMLDIAKDKLYAVTSFNPLAHMYIRGYGYFLHSDNTILGDVLKSLTGQDQDGVNVWESWYHHHFEGYTIIEMDLQSGFQFKQKYTPRFLHPKWNSQVTQNRTKTLVVASGGIDSGLTAYVLKKSGYDIELVHFLYGQKSQDCEEWAIREQARIMDVPFRIFDLRGFYYKTGEQGMLTSPDIGIDSGGNLIKSTIAWVSGRNAVFASMTMALAESLITQGKCDNVLISAGWSQLSEETGGYPDNSFQFNQALENLKMFGYITGSHINFLPVMQQLTKTEEWILGGALEFDFTKTVSCDNPSMTIEGPYLCIECGSTKLSMLASDRAGVIDFRKFSTTSLAGPGTFVSLNSVSTNRPILSEVMENPDIMQIIDRLILDSSSKQKLKDLV